MKNIFIVTLFFLALIFVLPAKARSEKLPELIYSGSLNSSVLPLLAIEKGWFKKEGIRIKFQQVLAGKIAMDHIISGNADIGAIVDTNVAFAGFQKNTYFKIIAAHEQAYYLAVIGRKDRGIFKPRDLIGKKIGVQPATGAHFYLSRFLKKHGIAKNQIEEVFLMSPVAVRAAIISGDVDVICIWEPHKNFAIKNIGKENITDFYDRSVYRVDILLAVGISVLKERSEDLKKFLRALIKAEKYAKENKDEVISLMSKKLMLDEDFLRSIWDDFVLTVNLTEDHYNLVKEGGEWIKTSQRGFADKPLPNYRRLFEPAVLREIAPEKATLN